MRLHAFRFEAGKIDRSSFKLPRATRAAVIAAGGHTPRQLHGALVTNTNLPPRRVQVRRGQLTIRN